MLIKPFIVKIFHAIVFSLACGYCMGCKDFKDCHTDATSLVKIAFKSLKTNADTAIQLIDITWVNANIPTEKFDKKTPKQKELFLMLNPNAYHATLIITTQTPRGDLRGERGELQLTYEKKIFFVSPACGAQQWYTLQAINYKNFKNAKITDPNLKRRAQQANVQIFF